MIMIEDLKNTAIYSTCTQEAKTEMTRLEQLYLEETIFIL